MSEPRALTVAEVIRETPDAHSLVFDATPAELPYRPGQFLTLRLPGGAARCYSLASSPHDGGRLKVTVKRVPGGRASNWICDNVTAGTVLETLPPAGTFTPRALDTDLLLLAAGSGITPVMSILTSALLAGTGRVTLVYANRDETSVIFAVALRELAAAHPGRLTVVHWLESVQGLPAEAALTGLLTGLDGEFAEAFVCGPAGFMDAATAALTGLGVARVHTERFRSLAEDPFAAPAPVTGETVARIQVDLDGAVSEHDWPAEARLLDVLLAAGLDAPFSCREGACSACACRVVEGEVKMLANEILDEADLADGWVLACQSLPLGERVRVTYEED
ncbi:ferredoxin--NADP reductase [Actinomadura hibisca]|uniref:ferredoxin--NADP reductase n=1 Tax=Actinomadura hibisca TaxID=68565 RepID=UPI00082A65BF|nr:ferredoxin--NADP reductase [Actinomadura hibisca]